MCMKNTVIQNSKRHNTISAKYIREIIKIPRILYKEHVSDVDKIE
jgi:hypothetical protein